MSPSLKRALVRVGGVTVAVVALGLCAYALARDWDRVSTSLANADPSLMVLSVVLGAGSMISLAVLWARCLAALGAVAPTRSVVGWYFAGELGKYLPGGVWQLIGRSELARRMGGIPRPTAYTSTMMAYATMCLGAAFVCGLASPFLALGPEGTSLAWFFAPAVVLVPLSVHPRVVGAAASLVARLTRRRLSVQALPWHRSIALVAWSLPAWLLLGAASAAVAAALDVEGGLTRVALAAIAAWIIGFLAIPVPAGAGVREVSFLVLSGLAAGPAVAVAVLARASLLVVDAVGGVIALLAQRGSRRPGGTAQS